MKRRKIERQRFSKTALVACPKWEESPLLRERYLYRCLIRPTAPYMPTCFQAVLREAHP